jgi:hypothetical protein
MSVYRFPGRQYAGELCVEGVGRIANIRRSLTRVLLEMIEGASRAVEPAKITGRFSIARISE